MQEYKNKTKNSIMHRHASEKDNNSYREIKYKMKVTGLFRNDPTLRQVTEGIKIKNCDSKHIINNKTECNSGNIFDMV